MWHFSVNLKNPIRLAVDVAIDAAHQPMLALVGPNGAGKSTFLRALAGFLGEGQGGLKGAPWQRPLAWVPQDPALLPHRTVRQQVEWVMNRELKHAPELSSWIELLDAGKWLDMRPKKLSGGQQQRAALLRALASRPTILALDEALSQIDAPSREAIAGHLRQWAEQADERLLIMTTHQFEDVAHWADRVLVLKDGSVLRDDEPAAIVRSPNSWDVAALVGYVARLMLNGRRVAVKSEGVSLLPPGDVLHVPVVRHRPAGLVVRLPVEVGRRDFALSGEQPSVGDNAVNVFVRGVPVSERG